jgi:transposase
MNEGITAVSGLTIGLDVGDKQTVGCVLSASGEVLETFRMATSPGSVRRTMGGFEPSRVVLEVGTHSPWMSRLVEEAGHELIIANPRRVRLISENDSKTDDVDAELLARLARVDPDLLKPIVHRGEKAQRDRILILARDGLVRSRTQFINQVRGFAKSLGQRMPRSSSEAFTKRVRERYPEDLFPGQSVMLEMIDRLSAEIARMDREVEKLCKEKYAETGAMRQVAGAGALT